VERRHLRLRRLGHSERSGQGAEAAKKFIAFSVQPQQQKTYSENIAYGPANTQAVPLLAKDVLKDMPTTPENIANQVQIDVASGLTTASNWSSASTPGLRSKHERCMWERACSR
jgi:spermidine/putrescine-binding protein